MDVNYKIITYMYIVIGQKIKYKKKNRSLTKSYRFDTYL